MSQGKDIILIHNPGGWGQTRLENCQEWEKSLVTGISTTLEEMGYSPILTQYFRTYGGWQEQMWDMKNQFRFFASKSTAMAAGIQFLIKHTNTYRIILIGVSQGAAFTNAVMQKLSGFRQVYSIEVGFFFPYMPWRRVSERTLALDDNGLISDPLVHRNLRAAVKAFAVAPFRWCRYYLTGRPKKFSYCINVSGHDYSWNYPEVQRQIVDFLESNLAINKGTERGPL